ncbi:MAG: hypothetical protein ACOYYS_19640 [Chloroflexota bacterium]
MGAPTFVYSFRGCLKPPAALSRHSLTEFSNSKKSLLDLLSLHQPDDDHQGSDAQYLPRAL